MSTKYYKFYGVNQYIEVKYFILINAIKE